MNFKIAVLPGDGIGPEVTNEAVKVLSKVGKIFNHTFEMKAYLIGGSAYDLTGHPLPQETVSGCQNSDAVLLGAVGGDKWDSLPGTLRPEKALLSIREALGLYANIRPAVMHEELSDACPLKPEVVKEGLDVCIVRELTGGIYFGEKGRFQKENSCMAAFDKEVYGTDEVERIARIAFEMARLRTKKVTSVDKANVLESSRLWREVVKSVALDYPDVVLEHMYVDNAAMQLIRRPSQFDVVVTSNMFGDILSDEASMITGSIGMLPSASIRADKFGLYEPIHGSAPDIAGQNLANPIATIASVGMMLRLSFGLFEEADAIDSAIKTVLENKYRTKDIMTRDGKEIGTREMGALISENIIRR